MTSLIVHDAAINPETGGAALSLLL